MVEENPESGSGEDQPGASEEVADSTAKTTDVQKGDPSHEVAETRSDTRSIILDQEGVAGDDPGKDR